MARSSNEDLMVSSKSSGIKDATILENFDIYIYMYSV